MKTLFLFWCFVHNPSNNPFNFDEIKIDVLKDMESLALIPSFLSNNRKNSYNFSVNHNLYHSNSFHLLPNRAVRMHFEVKGHCPVMEEITWKVIRGGYVWLFYVHASNNLNNWKKKSSITVLSTRSCLYITGCHSKHHLLKTFWRSHTRPTGHVDEIISQTLEFTHQ